MPHQCASPEGHAVVVAGAHLSAWRSLRFLSCRDFASRALLCRSTRRDFAQNDPGRRMVACLAQAPHPRVHPNLVDPFGCGSIRQQMIDPQAGIARPAVPEVAPERIDALLRMLAA